MGLKKQHSKARCRFSVFIHHSPQGLSLGDGNAVPYDIARNLESLGVLRSP
jgi:hypothetical protein